MLRTVILSALVVGFVAPQNARAQTIWKINGHAYQVVSSSLQWPDAKIAAEGMSFNGVDGHLATLTSNGESAFVFALLTGDEYYVGGQQLDPNDPPDVGWSWITGEAWCFTNWGPGEPNDATGDEHFLVIRGPAHSSPGTWNDERTGAGISGYVVEYPLPKTPPSPPPVGTQLIWQGNGHTYEVVSFSGSWPAAKAAAELMTVKGVFGNLATITSAEEDNFIAGMLAGNEYWVGGEQVDPNVPAADGWSWITGETWCYTNWGPGEPSDSAGGEQYLVIRGPVHGSPDTWNDELSGAGITGYVVEYPVPEVIPAVSEWGMVSLLLLLAAAGTIVLLKRRAMIAT